MTEIETLPTKRCRCCARTLPATRFFKNRHGNCQRRCKDCKRALKAGREAALR